VSRPTPQSNPHTRPCRTGFTDNAPDPAPLSARQLWALSAAATRELTWGLPAVAREVHRWRSLARGIPDAPIREDALSALTAKRSHIDGAALFSIVPRARNPSLLRLLVAYEIIWDFLDSVNERAAAAGLANGLQLHLALIDALDPERAISDYYQHSPWQDDGGYLGALVTVCRENCARLPSYEHVHHPVMHEAGRSRVCAINHDADPLIRDTTLEAWVAQEFPSGHEAWWFELTAAASTDLTIFALLALASEPTCPDDQITQTSRAYFPWASGLAAMLDSYVDQAEDAANGDHSYVAHYATPELATQRICLFIRRCLREVGSLKDGEKHILIVASMFAMYLSKSSALTPAMRGTTKRIAGSGGSLTRVLHPILRLWRTAYGLRSA
jgi:tetraprenyl-beta-curcumene synthase